MNLRPPAKPTRGTAVLIIIVLLAAMALILTANSTTLFWLKQEILRIEEQQIQSHGSGPNH